MLMHMRPAEKQVAVLAVGDASDGANARLCTRLSAWLHAHIPQHASCPAPASAPDPATPPTPDGFAGEDERRGCDADGRA